MDKEVFISTFQEALSSLEIFLTDSQLSKIQTHYEILARYNKVVNLTALKSPEDIAYRLFADSILPFTFFSTIKSGEILDLGPGGGFPSIPLAIILDSFTFTLVEKRERVALYLEDLKSDLSLKNVHVVPDRLENLTHRYSDYFDMSLNKAAFPPANYFKVISPFLKSDGYALYWASKIDTSPEVFHNWTHFKTISAPSDNENFPGSIFIYRKLSS